MKRTPIYIVALFIVLTQSIFAQSNSQAEKIISEILSDVKTNAIKTNFKLSISEKNNTQSQQTNGFFTLFGNKFILEMTDMKVYFDGKTQWAYVPKNNEVSITEPSEKELQETNPMAILSGFKAKSTIRFSTKSKSAQRYFIDLIPKIKQQGIAKIEIVITKSSKNIESIKILNTSGNNTLLTLTNYKNAVINSSNNFTFHPNKYKGIVINDLR